MKIDPTGPLGTQPTRRRDKASSAGSGNFAKHVGGSGAAPGSLGGAGPIGAVDALLALQEVEDSTSEQAEARARQRGAELLDRLDEIRHGLLTGRISRHTLDELARTARAKRGQTANPQLAEVLDEIELRAEVELAKLDYEA